MNTPLLTVVQLLLKIGFTGMMGLVIGAFSHQIWIDSDFDHWSKWPARAIAFTAIAAIGFVAIFAIVTLQ